MRLHPRSVFVIAALASAIAAAPAQAFDAHGSARQVYVTGLAPNTNTTLTNAAGKQVKAQNADAQGAVLFRHVKPGDGYKVSDGSTTSEPLTVITNNPEPPNTHIYNQQIASSGAARSAQKDLVIRNISAVTTPFSTKKL